LQFDWSQDPPRLLVNGRDVTDRLRDADVTSGASEIAVMGQVRQVLVEAQRRIGCEHPRLVTEGRDQGSVVFPGAQVKFYLDADPPVRARRRANQMRQAGKEADEQQILEAILIRDQRDRSRCDGPLVCADDALRVDTSDMTLDEVVDYLEQQVRSRTGN
jgi:cytidylate kinase